MQNLDERLRDRLPVRPHDVKLEGRLGLDGVIIIIAIPALRTRRIQSSRFLALNLRIGGDHHRERAVGAQPRQRAGSRPKATARPARAESTDLHPTTSESGESTTRGNPGRKRQGLLQTPTALLALIGMPQDPQERLARLNGSSWAERGRQIVAGVLPKPMNHPVRDPGRRVEEVEDGDATLQGHDDQIQAPDVGQLMKQDPP